MTTDTQRALLAEICAKPEEDSVRLAYADYLEESGDASAIRRAEYIRLQVEQARLVVPPVECGRAPDGRLVDRCQSCHWTGITCRYHELDKRIRYLFNLVVDGKRESDSWVPGLRDAMGSPFDPDVEVRWHRGFLVGLNVPFNVFVASAHRLLWRPGLTELCREVGYNLYGVHVTPDEPRPSSLHPARKCLTCNGTGFAPVPCPDCACPIRWVTFTSVPMMSPGQYHCFGHYRCNSSPAMSPTELRQYFPWVRFYVTSEVLDHDDTPASWANPDALYDKQDEKNGIDVDAPESGA